MQKLRSLYPWMNPDMMDAYSQEWTATSNEQLATNAVRATAAWKTKFQGNYDEETGNVRMSENDYMASKAAFDATITSVNLNPTYFGDDFITALENEISPSELIGRMESAYERVIMQSAAIKDFYSQNYNIEMTDSAILASLINPDVGQQILDRRIAVSEIGGEAAARGYGIDVGFGERLAQAGVDDRDSAGQFFGQAANLIPMMQTLQARHGNPDDAFNLEDVSSAVLFDDPETRRQIRKARAQESSTFTGGAGLDYKKSQQGGVAGLAQQ